ncbi:MAG TPA: HEAT repeat domain-containing protein [Allocoleopsis sp.]
MTITPDSVKQLLNSQDLGDRLKSVNLLRQLEPEIAFELAQIAVNDSNPRVRYSAVSLFDTLGNVDRNVSLNILRDRLLNDPEFDVQAAAADALGALQFKEAFDDLVQVYQSTSEWLLQFSIISILGLINDERAFDILVKALDSENGLVQTAAISSLGDLGDERAIEKLAPFVDHSDWQLRYRLTQTLTQLGGKDARNLLEKLANDPFEQVAKEAKAGL